MTASSVASEPTSVRHLTAEDYPALMALVLAHPDPTTANLLPVVHAHFGVSCVGTTLDAHLRKAGLERHATHRPPQDEAGDGATRYQPHHRPQTPQTGYPSDLTDAQWDRIEPLLRPPRWNKPCTDKTRATVNAIFYVVRTGCPWRYVPKDFPHWGTVSKQFSRWQQRGVWQAVNDALRSQVRHAEGRSEQPSVALVDTQTVQTTEKGG